MTKQRTVSLRDRLAVPIFFAFATVVFTWPTAFSPGQLPATKGDGIMGLWNMWWAATALLDLGVSPFWTDYLHYPTGVSLARTAFSPGNAIVGGILGRGVGLVVAWKLLILIHFWLSAWFCFLFARALTGSTLGSVLAGLLWSFSPYHYYYLPQLNLVTMEFLPLLAFFVVQTHRDGGLRNLLGVVISAALLTSTAPTYAVFGGLLAAAMMVGGRFWAPEATAWLGARRLALAGLAALPGIVGVAWPLISESLAAAGSGSEPTLSPRFQPHRVNDLFGFYWLIVPEKVTLSWPTLLGYSSLILASIGAVVTGRRGAFWTFLALLFGVFSLGPTLHIGGEDSGIPLLYEGILRLPLISMLRKPDRFAALLQLCICILAAYGWQWLDRLRPGGVWRGAIAIFGVVAVLERIPAPLDTFVIDTSPYFQSLPERDDVRALIDLPLYGGGTRDVRATYLQTLHRKKMPQGRVTGFATTPHQVEQARIWNRTYQDLTRGDPRGILFLANARGIDRVVLQKKIPVYRRPADLSEGIVWRPFAFVDRRLLQLRQLGILDYEAIKPDQLSAARDALVQAVGAPEFEDDEIIVFRSQKR